jgi:ATP-dependent DNA helicase RecG
MAPRASTALLTASVARLGDKEVPKTRLKRSLSAGTVAVTVGTHALLQEDVSFRKLALAVVDEQHRFGTAQRARLAKAKSTAPHLLTMTATPIPRTLALTVFGDLDISVLKEKPAGRTPVATQVVDAHGRTAMEAFIREQIRQGRQAFVICPVIEKQESQEREGKRVQRGFQWAEAKAVTEEYERLKKSVFPKCRMAMLHGRMKSKDKDRVMREFRDGWHDILVSTTVVEVGVDVPNATVMLVEGADRFGLAQLHQLRGRVGRSDLSSYCFLVSSDGGSTARLRALEKTEDGFKLAETDLKLRGPGQFFGVRQSGMSDLAMAALADPETVKKARLAARTIMKDDPMLKKHPLLRELLDSFASLAHGE